MAQGAKTGRRWLLRGLPGLVLAGAAGPARAAAVDLVVTCDTTLAPALRKLGAAYGARSGVRVFVFPTGPGLIVPQLLRDIQNDIVVTQVAILDQAAQAGVIASAPSGTWHNPLVIAGVHGASATDRTFAASDPSPASDIDGPALLSRLGLQPARLLGAVDTDEVAFLLTTGAAQAGLLHMTDVRADQRLEVIRPVLADIHPPIVYAASATRLARRPNPQGFIAFLASPEAVGLLTQSGLEVHA
jgi:ABC-type molybdate transport system substrate-binding protein